VHADTVHTANRILYSVLKPKQGEYSTEGRVASGVDQLGRDDLARLARSVLHLEDVADGHAGESVRRLCAR